MNTPRGRILVVDDEPGLRATLAANLGLEGFEVKEAASGEEAVKLVEAGETFDLVLSDIWMPGMSGVEVSREVRRMRPGMAVVMMTAFAAERLVIDVLKEGAYTVIQKPFSMELLLQVVRRALADKAILVVDDDRDFTRSLVTALENAGLRAEAVYDGEEAVKRIRNGVVDACVLDLVLPGQDGVQTYKEIRELDPSIPVIAITGKSVEQMVYQVISHGSYACLRKPFDTAQLIRTIARARGRPAPVAERTS
jgi:DNA-binding NtrC family response regulator